MQIARELTDMKLCVRLESAQKEKLAKQLVASQEGLQEARGSLSDKAEQLQAMVCNHIISTS